MEREEVCDVFVAGLGVTGAAATFFTSRFVRNIKRIVCTEQYPAVALVNSNAINNSQTLHSGEIETNFTLEKALEVRDASKILATFLEKYGTPGITFRKLWKMVLGVGPKEVAFLKDRFEFLKPHFPHLQILDSREIGKIEPNIVKGRSPHDEIVALFSPTGFAVNYQALAGLFVAQAKKTPVTIDTFFNTKIKNLVRENGWWKITTTSGMFKARFVVIACGPYSMLFAHHLGYARHLAILPVAGSFYKTIGALHGKVYTVQEEKIPFAAVHGDPAVYNPLETRFGPTAKVLPLFERHHWATFIDFVRAKTLTPQGILSLFRIIADRDILAFVVRNILYDIPFLGKLLFLQNVKKIVPSLKYRDITFAKGAGGLRPQIINTTERRLEAGTEEIVGDNIVFVVTPSPGASKSGKTGEVVARHVASALGKEHEFDEKGFREEFPHIQQIT